MRRAGAERGVTGPEALTRQAPLLPRAGGAVLLAELVHASGSIDDLLLARVERMAAGAHFHLQVVSERGTRLERVAAGAGDRHLFVRRMDIGLHGNLGRVAVRPWMGSGGFNSKGRRV